MFPPQPAFDTAPDISQVPIGQPEMQSPMAFKPETRAQDALFQMIQNIPQRNNPGMLRKIAASMANVGTGNLGAGDQFMYAPYYQQMQDFDTRLKPTIQLADQERQSNNVLRQISADAARNDAVLRRLDIQDRDLQRKTDKDKADIAIREKRASTYDWKARNPNMEIETDAEGRLIGIDPQTGKTVFITGSDGKPIMSNELSTEDKANLQIKVARARGEISRNNAFAIEEERQKNRLEVLDRRAQIRKNTATNDKNMSVSQDAAAWKLAIQQYVTDNPQHRKFWDNDGPTDAAINDDEYTSAVDGPDGVRERYNRIKQRVGGTRATTPDTRKADTNKNKVLPPAQRQQQAPVAPKGWKYVPKAGGGWTAVEDK